MTWPQSHTYEKKKKKTNLIMCWRQLAFIYLLHGIYCPVDYISFLHLRLTASRKNLNDETFSELSGRWRRQRGQRRRRIVFAVKGQHVRTYENIGNLPLFVLHNEGKRNYFSKAIEIQYFLTKEWQTHAPRVFHHQSI